MLPLTTLRFFLCFATVWIGWELAAVAQVPENKNNPPALSDVVDGVDDGVVLITTQNALRQDTGSASGFVIDAKGLVATNFHVLSTAVYASVQFRDGRKFEVAGVRAISPERDLAILELKDAPDQIESFALKDPGALKQGMELVAIGHPSGFKFTVTTGIVSAVRQTKDLPLEFQQVLGAADDTEWVQTSAAISHGSSGGPLLNKTGRLVAINAWIAEGQNLGFAVHVKHLIDLSKSLSKDAVPLPVSGLGLVTDAKVAALLAEYLQELQQLGFETQQEPDEEKQLLLVNRKHPAPDYAKKLIELAERHPKSTTGFEALCLASQMARANFVKTVPLFEKALERLERDYLDEPRMHEFAGKIRGDSRPRTIRLLKRLVLESPHREVRAKCCSELATSLATLDDQSYVPEITAFLEDLAKNYGDVKLAGRRVAATVEDDLFWYCHLSVGRIAPSIKGQDIHGKPLVLENFRGNVTVIDFWADWSPYCRVMYEKERRLVEDFKDRPFALLGVNTDEKPTLERLVSAGTVTWQNWHDGPEGPIAKDWQVLSFPTVFVLDAEGRIRHRNLPGIQLRSAIEMLLSEKEFDLPRNHVALGHSWAYHPATEKTSSDWNQRDFDDTNWSNGQSPLGYGWGDEVTTLSDRTARTMLFRTQFQVEEPSSIKDLMVELFADDAAVVWLNGSEVVRTGLSKTAGLNSPATKRNQGHGRIASYFAVNPELVVAGKNSLAVEVHQHTEADADLRFDLAVSSNVIPHLRKTLKQTDSPALRRSVTIIGELGPAAQSCAEDLKPLLDSGDVDLETRVITALSRISPTARLPRLPKPQSDEINETRQQFGFDNAIQSVHILRTPGLSQSDYQAAHSDLAAVQQILPPEFNDTEFKALGEYRLGRFAEAMNTVRGGFFFTGELTPTRLACMTMCHHYLGKKEDAQTTLKQLRDLLEKPEWARDLEGYRLLKEAEALIEGQPQS